MDAKEFFAEFKQFCDEMRDAGVEAKAEQAVCPIILSRRTSLDVASVIFP